MRTCRVQLEEQDKEMDGFGISFKTCWEGINAGIAGEGGIPLTSIPMKSNNVKVDTDTEDSSSSPVPLGFDTFLNPVKEEVNDNIITSDPLANSTETDEDIEEPSYNECKPSLSLEVEEQVEFVTENDEDESMEEIDDGAPVIHTAEKRFACNNCDKRYTDRSGLRKHMLTHTAARPFSCDQCGKSFGLKYLLKLHLRTHSGKRPYACDQCSKGFSEKKDLRRHLVVHSGETPLKCWICGKAFKRKDNLDRHIKRTHKQSEEVAKELANKAAAEHLLKTGKRRIY